MTVTLAFPNGPVPKTSNNNLLNLNVVGIGFDTSGGFTINGFPISLSSGVGATGGINVLNLPIQLASNIDTNVVGTLYVDGAISGAFGITKTGDGTLSLGAANSYSGGVIVNAGRVTLSDANAGGTGVLAVENGATLAAANAVDFLTNPLSLSGAGSSGLGALHFEGAYLLLTGPIALAGSTTIQSTNPNGILELVNAINGPSPATLTLDGPAFTFSGVYSTTFAGLISVPHGTLTLDRSGGATAVAGNLSLGPGDGLAAVGVTTQAANQFSPSSQVTLGANTTFQLEGYNQTIRGLLAWDRPCEVLLGGDQNTTLTFNTVLGPQNYVNCDVIGTGKLSVMGSGMQSFEHNDPAVPFNGTLDVQASAASYLEGFHMAGAYFMHPNSAGGLLGAGSTLGSILVDDAYFAIEMLSPAEATQAGSLMLNGAGSDIIFEFLATGATGPKVTGLVSLGNATPYVCYYTGFEPGLASAQAKQRTLVDAASPVTGTFNGLPEGSQISASHCLQHDNPYLMRLSYHGGDGYDVVVSRVIQDNLTLQVLPTPNFSNQVVNLQAVLAPLEETYGATASKKVAFYDGSQLIGEASFINNTAVLTGVQFAPGAHSVQARFVGDPNFADALSGTTSFSVKGLVFIPVLRK